MHRNARALLLAASLLACTTTSEPGRSASDLTAASSEPGGRETVIDTRSGMRLLSGPPSVGAPQTDERPSYRMRVEGNETFELPERVLGGALVDGGVVFVTTQLSLVDGAGHVIDEHVIPELAVRDDGRALAYAHAAGETPGVYVIEGGDARWSAPRLVTPGLETADRPLWLEDGRLVVVGALPSGIAGVWLVDPSSAQALVPVTNSTLRTGRPFGDAFVPPPAYHESMRVEADVLTYDDGRGQRRVPLVAEVVR